MTYRIRFAPRAERDLKGLQKQTCSQIKRKIDALAENPFPDGVKKLTGNEKLFRIRVGDYRIIYSIDKGELTVLIITIRHRREVYRR